MAVRCSFATSLPGGVIIRLSARRRRRRRRLSLLELRRRRRMGRRWWWSLLVKIEGDPLNTQHAQHRPVQATDR